MVMNLKVNLLKFLIGKINLKIKLLKCVYGLIWNNKCLHMEHIYDRWNKWMIVC